MGDFTSDDPGFEETPGIFYGTFVAISDADMAGTAYADGKLEPFNGASDEMTLFRNGRSVATAAVSNSVVSWPQIAVASPDGRHIYAIETRGSLSKEIEQVESAFTAFPSGHIVSAFEVRDQKLIEVSRIENVGLNPQSIDISSNGRFLAISSETANTELTIVPLDEQGLLGEARFISMNPPFQPGDKEKRARTLHLSPDGTMIALNVGNVRYQFYSLIFDDSGVPEGVTAIGAPIEFGVRLSIGRWSRDGRFLIVTDVNAYDSGVRMLFQRGGQLHVIKAPTAETPAELIDSKRVGRFAEGLELSDDGSLIASIAMERTYLPELFFLETWPRRRTYLLTLFSFDSENGTLVERDRIRTAGVLPEDVIFDKQGSNLAVAVFHRRKGLDRKRGFIDFFEISDDLQLTPQGRTQAVMRGPHDLVRLPD
ncbi:MAG: hypothetical protein AAF950_04480 [Pseudomonadota bacterium]